jgi:hypothetical protein
MDQSTENKVLEALYNRLFQAVTYAPADQASLFDVKTTFIQFAKNQPLWPKDYKNQLSPVNPKGSPNTAEMFSRMVDNVPAISSDYAITSDKVGDTYLRIVDGANTELQVDQSQKDLYDKAYAYLNVDVQIKDYTGTTITSHQPSPIYSAYLSNQKAYTTALCSYRTAYLGYNLSNIDDQRKWQANEPMLQMAVSQTYDTWRAQGAAQVEQALAVLASSINNIVSSTINAAQKTMHSSSMASSLGNPLPWYLAYPTPSNWYDDSALPNFSALTFKSDNLTKSSDTNYTKYSAGAGAGWGLWSVGGDVSGEHSESHAHMDADHFELSADIAVVQINRPWMNDLLFRMNGWSLLGQAAGSISNAILDSKVSHMLPLTPTAFIVARNVAITANWSTEDKKHVEDSITTHAKVGWGPFSVNGSYSHGSSSDYFNSTFNGDTLTVPGMQVIAWVNQIMPFSAPLSGIK